MADQAPKQVAVAAAVITRADGHYFLGQRAGDTFYPGYWEFPGGKVEAGETPREALIRELREELDIEVEEAWPWLVREHRYEHAHVRLHFFEVPRWRGDIVPAVHVATTWQRPGPLEVSPMLPANGPIVKGLSLPRVMALTQATTIGVDAQLAALDRALAAGLRCVQVREPGMPADALARFAAEVLARCRAYGAMAILNAEPALAQSLGMDGVHLSAHRLAALATRPELAWVGASCHSRAELERVAALDLDYAVLGTVKPSASHPSQPTLGWQAFHTMTRDLPMPVIAIGGLDHDDMPAARQAGAHGIACIRAAWR